MDISVKLFTIRFLRVQESYLQWILNPVAIVSVIVYLLAQ